MASQSSPSPGSDPPDYSDVISFEESPLYQAVVNFDVMEIRHFLDLEYTVNETGKFGQTLLHALIYSLSSQPPESPTWTSPARLKIVYMLSNAEIDMNAKDQTQQTALQYAAQCGDAELCEVLLQCGSDMFVPEENGLTLYENVSVMADNANYTGFHQTKSLANIFEKYHPGLWQGVATESLTEVRKLVNLWCKTDLTQNQKTLRELAVDTGNEGITSLVNAVIPSMRLVHKVLAGDVKGAKELLCSALRNKIHINFKNLSRHSAPILYFVIQERNLEMLKEFRKQGSSIVTHMRDMTDDCEMPVLFSAIQPDMPAPIIAELLPEPQHARFRLLEQLTYKGKNILQVALERGIATEAVNAIIEKGGARLICIRNMNNQTARDWVVTSNKPQYAELIDKHVSQWVLHAALHSGQRETLALWGYEHVASVVYQWMEDNCVAVQEVPEDVLQFLEGLDMYQEQIAELAQAVENNDLVTFKDKMVYSGDGPFERDLWWDGRQRGDGLPMLHRAVLYNHTDIASYILQLWENRGGQDAVDSLVDQSRRTALHYACGMELSSAICSLLHQYGCSEHMLDKDGHEPLDFTEVSGSPPMRALLDRVRYQRYHLPEPNPWEANALAALRQQRMQRFSVVPYNHSCQHQHTSFSSNCLHANNSHTLPVMQKAAPHSKHKNSVSHSQSQVLTKRHSKENLQSTNKVLKNLNVDRSALNINYFQDSVKASSRETLHLLDRGRRRATLAEEEHMDSDEESQTQEEEACTPLLSRDGGATSSTNGLPDDMNESWEEHAPEQQRNCTIL